MSGGEDALGWLRDLCGRYEHEPVAVYRRRGSHAWPIEAADADDLERQLREGGHFLPLPKESASLANVIEVSLVDFLLRQVEGRDDIRLVRGTERGYPDLELTGSAFGDEHHAIDVKTARRAVTKAGRLNPKRTQSRITLYTGNTYFRHPELRWPGTFRPFQDYASHIDILAIYTLDEASDARVRDLELIVQEAWRIGSRQRSSTTREYIGAVDDIELLREGRGEFETANDFYRYWRRFHFKIGRTVEEQLKKLLKEQGGGSDRGT